MRSEGFRRATLGLAVLAAFMVVDSALAHYNPATGRFLNRDPIGEPGARIIQAVAARAGTGFIPRDPIAHETNLYRCVKNTPTMLVDPLGLQGKNPTTPQCKLDGSPVSFIFDGEDLAGSGPIWEAVSGMPVSKVKAGKQTVGGVIMIKEVWTFDYSVARQKMKNIGPIPVGGYWIDICDEGNFWTGPITHGVKRKAWGWHRWPLTPYPGTETYGRSGFYLHGGHQWDSLGCIDVKSGTHGIKKLFKKLKKQNCCCHVVVDVSYPKMRVTKTEWKFGGIFWPEIQAGPKY